MSLNTAIRAYYELEKNGYVLTRPKSGYFVNYRPLHLEIPRTTRPPMKSGDKDVVDLINEVYNSLEIADKSITRFSLGMPEDVLLPINKLNKELIRAMRSLPGNGTHYDETQGNVRLRKYAARFTYSWNGNLTENDIVTTAGVTNAVALALSATTKNGDTIAIESPVYFGILQLAKSLGLRIIEVPTNPVTGIEPDALKPDVLKKFSKT